MTYSWRMTEGQREARAAKNGVVRCPECNADALNNKGLARHKSSGACLVVPGARKRVAVLIAEYYMAVA